MTNQLNYQLLREIRMYDFEEDLLRTDYWICYPEDVEDIQALAAHGYAKISPSFPPPHMSKDNRKELWMARGTIKGEERLYELGMWDENWVPPEHGGAK